MRTWRRMAPLTNRQSRCDCGSGYMPTLLEQARARWACLACYQIETPRVSSAGGETDPRPTGEGQP
jgi:hypothetical protein